MRLQLLFWIAKPESKGRVVDAINTKIYENLKENKISIPYPTMEVIIPPQIDTPYLNFSSCLSVKKNAGANCRTQR